MVKKGRHRRFEEARALKRTTDIDFEDLFESLQADRPARDDDASDSEWTDYEDSDDDPPDYD